VEYPPPRYCLHRYLRFLFEPAEDDYVSSLVVSRLRDFEQDLASHLLASLLDLYSYHLENCVFCFEVLDVLQRYYLLVLETVVLDGWDCDLELVEQVGLLLSVRVDRMVSVLLLRELHLEMFAGSIPILSAWWDE
jgi:hypothetical protein